MSTETESPQVEEASQEKSMGRRNPRRSTRNAATPKKEEAPESRRSSRRSQASSKGSETQSRVTRGKGTRSRKKSGSPTFRSKGATSEDSQESPASRVKSSRRTSSRINYKESEGEEDALSEHPKEEEEYNADEDWDDSEGEGKKKEMASKRPQSKPPRKSSTTPKETKSRKRSSGSTPTNKRTERTRRGKKTEEEMNEESKGEEEEEMEKDEDAHEKENKLEEIKIDKESNDNVKDTELKKSDSEEAKNVTEKIEEPVVDKDNKAAKEMHDEVKMEDSSKIESNKRKFEDESGDKEMESKKPKIEENGDAKPTETASAYLRTSPVIVENKHALESKESQMETDSHSSQDSQGKSTNESKTNDSVQHLEASHSSLGSPSTDSPVLKATLLNTQPSSAIPGSNGAMTNEKLYIKNPLLTPEKIEALKPSTFKLVSYNLQGPDSFSKQSNILSELKTRHADIVCLQSFTSSFYDDKIAPSIKELGYSEVIAEEGLGLLYKPDMFELVSHSPISLQSIIEKDLEGKPAEIINSVIQYLTDFCGKAQLVELRFRHGNNSLLRLCNVSLPTLLDPSCTTLLMCRLLREVNSPSSGASHLLCGEFNPVNWVSQVLSTGTLSDELSQEMRRRKDIFLPNQEAISLVELLPNLHVCPSLQYTNCYTTIMGSQKSSGGSDQVWASMGTLTTIGVWEPHLALQASLAFTN